jgi:hypothetical protein
VQDFLGDNPSPAECRPKQLGGLAGSSSSAGLARSGPSTTQHSRSSSQGGLAAGTGSTEDEELERAIQLSLQQQQQERPSQSSQSSLSRVVAAPSSSSSSSAVAPTVFDFTKAPDTPAPATSPQPGFSASEVRRTCLPSHSLQKDVYGICRTQQVLRGGGATSSHNTTEGAPLRAQIRLPNGMKGVEKLSTAAPAWLVVQAVAKLVRVLACCTVWRRRVASSASLAL